MPKGLRGFQKGHHGFRDRSSYGHSRETREKMSKSHTGMVRPSDVKKKIAESMKKVMANTKHRERISSSWN